METTANKGSFANWIKKHAKDFIPYCGLIVCIIIFSVIPPIFGESIWTGTRLSNLMSDVIVNALLSVGAVFVYSLGNMDISIGSQMRVYAYIIIVMANSTGSLLWGILISLAIALVVAVINGAAGQLLHIHSIVPSLVFMMIFAGLSTMFYVNHGSRNITLTSLDCSILKNPIVMLIVLIIETAIISYFFYFTKAGKNAKAIGANPLAAEQSGINLLKYKILCYIILSVCVVIATLFQMGYTGSASDSTGTGYEMNVMVALILGGMPLSGGMKSKVSCAIVGSFTYSILSIGLPLIGVPNNMTFFIKAIIFIIVVLITCRKKDGTLPR